MTVGRRLRSASRAFERGEHPAVVTTLEPLLDDSARWTALGRADSRVAADAAYMGGISRLVVGDPDGAAAWLRLATDTPDVPPRIRRALAQVELARGEIDAARELLDDGEGAALLDRALLLLAALRAGDIDDAGRRAADLEKRLAQENGGNPLTEAGVHAQLGFVLVELGEAERATRAADAIAHLAVDSPATLPLAAHERVIRAGARRLAGDLDGAAASLDALGGSLTEATCDRGLAEREDARLQRAREREAAAQDAFDAAVRTFDAAGERWLAAATRREAGAA